MMASSMTLSFLRPLAMPKPATLHHFLGVARVSTTTASTTSPSSTPSPPTESASTTQTLRYPYRVTRTPSNNYPIYTLSKRGGNMKLTKLRRIEGDVNALRKDLLAALKVPENEVVINQLTRHIIVKGHKKPAVEKFLQDRRL